MDPSDPPRDGPKEAPLAPIAEGGSAKDATPAAPAPPQDPAAGKPPRDQKDAPLRKLTTGLLGTYKLINQRYYEAKKARQARSKAEEYQVVPGDMLGGHYKVDESLGKGSFGQVVSATDSRSGAKVAVKVIKNKDAFRRQARTEIRLLELLNKKDPDDQWCIVRFLETFDHLGHTCIVFEHLSYNLYELIRKTHFRGVALQLIRKFARQILKSLAYLALPEVDIIHCDLKPENILFRVANRSAIKVIDFGSSCQSDKKMYKYIQSRFYRSPEVVLELPYDHAIDMWSLGCILVELHTGMPLFSGKDEADQMRRFVALKGMPPLHMLRSSKKLEKFFEVTFPPLQTAADAPPAADGPPPEPSAAELAAAAAAAVRATAVAFAQRQLSEASAAAAAAMHGGSSAMDVEGAKGGGGARRQRRSGSSHHRHPRGYGRAQSAGADVTMAAAGEDPASAAGKRRRAAGGGSAGTHASGGGPSSRRAPGSRCYQCPGCPGRAPAAADVASPGAGGDLCGSCGLAGRRVNRLRRRGVEVAPDDLGLLIPGWFEDVDEEGAAPARPRGPPALRKAAAAGSGGSASSTPRDPPTSAAAVSAGGRASGAPPADADDATLHGGSGDVDDGASVASSCCSGCCSGWEDEDEGGAGGSGSVPATPGASPEDLPMTGTGSGWRTAAAAATGGGGAMLVDDDPALTTSHVPAHRSTHRVKTGLLQRPPRLCPTASDIAAFLAPGPYCACIDTAAIAAAAAASEASAAKEAAAAKDAAAKAAAAAATMAVDAAATAAAAGAAGSSELPTADGIAALVSATSTLAPTDTKDPLKAAVNTGAGFVPPGAPTGAVGYYRVKPYVRPAPGASGDKDKAGDAAKAPASDKDKAGDASAAAPAAVDGSKDKSDPSAAAAAAAAPKKDEKPHREPPVYTNLRDVLGVHSGGPGGRRRGEKVGHSDAHYTQFMDLVERMLDWDPRTRIRPMAALNHPFLRDEPVAGEAGGASASGAAPTGGDAAAGTGAAAAPAPGAAP